MTGMLMCFQYKVLVFVDNRNAFLIKFLQLRKKIAEN